MTLVTIDINGLQFKFNKTDLCKSPYFQKFLSDEWKNDKPLKIFDPKIEPEVDGTLDILYTISSLAGKPPKINEDNCLTFYEYSNYFMVEPLFEKCSKYLKKNMTKENVFSFLQIGWKFGIESKLFQNCSKFIKYFINDSNVQENIFIQSEEIISEILSDNDIWFESTSNRITFVEDLILALLKKYNCTTLNECKINPKLKKTLTDFLEGTPIHQLKFRKFCKVITNGYLDLEIIKKAAASKIDPNTFDIRYFEIYGLSEKFRATEQIIFKDLKGKLYNFNLIIDIVDNNFCTYLILDNMLNEKLPEDVNLVGNIRIKFINYGDWYEINNYNIPVEHSNKKYKKLNLKYITPLTTVNYNLFEENRIERYAEKGICSKIIFQFKFIELVNGQKVDNAKKKDYEEVSEEEDY